MNRNYFKIFAKFELSDRNWRTIDFSFDYFRKVEDLRVKTQRCRNHVLKTGILFFAYIVMQRNSIPYQVRRNEGPSSYHLSVEYLCIVVSGAQNKRRVHLLLYFLKFQALPEFLSYLGETKLPLD